MKNSSALTVSQLNTYVKMMFESDSRLQRICVAGEISNFVNHYKTGHCYFSLKDNFSAVKVVMFAKSAQYLKFIPENGMRVYITGRVSVFERDGVYQLYADSMEPEGTGALMLAFEQLREKLYREGLFDDKRKKELPRFPKKTAVITSAGGAALQDVINVISRRYPMTELIVVSVSVQGTNCASDNIKALKIVNSRSDIDLIIMARGGGSVEDLWGYNDEMLVRAVAASDIPIITGIGHEVDFTLCDFAADMRAPTPSAAAELAVPDIEELYQTVDGMIFRLDSAITKYFKAKDAALDVIESKLRLLDPSFVLKKRAAEYDIIKKRLSFAIEKYMNERETALKLLSDNLEFLNPFEMLKKGFIPIYKNDKRIRSIGDLAVGDDINLKFADGEAICTVSEIK